MEMVRDPALLTSIRNEVESVAVRDSSTGRRTFDLQRLVNLPLLQSVFTEVMRLHVSINLTREVTGPLKVGGYMLEKGAVMQVPTEIAHYNKAVWGVEGHPADEFWAERHIKWVEAVDEGIDMGEKNDKTKMTRVPIFEIKGRPTDLFPFGKFQRNSLEGMISS